MEYHCYIWNEAAQFSGSSIDSSKKRQFYEWLITFDSTTAFHRRNVTRLCMFTSWHIFIFIHPTTPVQQTQGRKPIPTVSISMANCYGKPHYLIPPIHAFTAENSYAMYTETNHPHWFRNLLISRKFHMDIFSRAASGCDYCNRSTTILNTVTCGLPNLLL